MDRRRTAGPWARQRASWASPSRRIDSPIVADEPGLLGERQELVRPEQATLGVQPAGQRLEPDDVARRQLDDRLVVGHDLAAVDAAAQLGGGPQGEHRRLVGTRRVRLDAVAPACLGPVHRAVGVAEQLGRRRARRVVDGVPDARRHVQLGALDVDRLADRCAQRLGDDARDRAALGCRAATGEHDDELVTAEAAEQRARGPTASASRRDIAVSSWSPMPWPRLSLTVLKLSRSMNSRATAPSGAPSEQGVDPGEQLGAVGQAGEVVVGGRPAQLVGGAQLLGDVLDVGDRQRHALVLGHRDPGAGPDVLAVAAQVALVEQVGVDDAELEPVAVGGGGACRSSGWVISRMLRPTRSSIGRCSISASERLASMICESSSRTSAMPVGAEWNACWNRRRACSSARDALLPLGDVAQSTDDRPRRRRAARPVVARFDRRRSCRRRAARCSVIGSALSSTAALGEPRVELVVVGRRRRARGAVGRRCRRGRDR